jgi:hypothetical protein
MLPSNGVFAEQFPSNGSPSWLHNSGYQQIYHNVPWSRHQNAHQIHRIKTDNRSFENVASSNIWERQTNQNLIQEEIKSRLNFNNACYRSVQMLLSSRLLSTNVKIRIYKSDFVCGSVWV